MLPAIDSVNSHNRRISVKIFAESKKLKTAPHLSLGAPPDPGDSGFLWRFVDFFSGDGMLNMLSALQDNLGSSSDFMGSIATSLHNKMKKGGRIHELMLVWTKIQQAMLMNMQAGADLDSSTLTVGSFEAKSLFGTDVLQGWYDRLKAAGAAGIDSLQELKDYSYSQVVDVKDMAQQDATSAQALTDEKRAQLQSEETNYSTLATLWSSLQQSYKSMLMTMCRF